MSIRTPEQVLLSSSEAAAYLGVSLNTLYRMERDGHLTPYRTPGGHRRFHPQMLDSYLESSKMYRGSKSISMS
jgi:excisionase family DNA binding protein